MSTDMKQSVMNKEIGFFLSMPKEPRKACNYLLFAAVLKGLVLIFVLGMMIFGRIPDSTGWAIAVVGALFLSYLVACAITAIVHLYRGKRSGRVWAWLVLPFLLPGFPLMTVVAVSIIMSLHSKEMDAYLRGKEMAA